jgi:DNA-binding NtrC family response regulator
MKFPLTLAGGLRAAFADLVSTPLPRHLADLMRQLHEDRDNHSGGGPVMGQAQQRHRAVLIVEDDADIRSLTAALLEDEQVDTIECESAEAALATMLIGGREVAMIFADVRLRGVMDGIDLAREVRMRWPLLPVILTSGHPREHFGELPPGVGYMPKPWKPLNLLVAAEQALGEFISRQGRQSIVQGAKEVGRTTSQGIAEASRRGSEAA